MRSEIEFETTLIIKEREKREMGSGASTKKVQHLNDALRKIEEDFDDETKEIFEKMPPKGFVKTDGRHGFLCPFVTACKLGRVKIVKEMIAKDEALRKRKIKESIASVALLKNAENETHEDIVSALVRHGADVNAAYMGESVLHACARVPIREGKMNTRVWLARNRALDYLLENGADMEETNADGYTPLVVACADLNENAALKIARHKASILPVSRWLNTRKTKARQKGVEFTKDWVAGKILERYAFKHPIFVKQIRERFMKQFDTDDDGTLSRDEVVTFFAAMVKVQFAAGKDPISAFKDDGSLTIAQIRKLLEERCKYELGAWFLFDRNKDGDYTWKELLPLVKDFWHHIWNKNRPRDEKEIKTSVEAMHALEIEHGNVIEDVKQDEKLTKQEKNEEEEERKQESSSQQQDNENIEEKDDETNTSTTNNELEVVKDEESARLPDNWVKVKDPSSGECYYANTETQLSQWEFPTE